jgi:hypothetical protein
MVYSFGQNQKLGIMKKIVLLILVTTGFFAKAQKNLAYFELGGAGPMISLNYEKYLGQEENFSIRLGYGYASAWDAYHTLPVGIYHLQDMKRNNEFELGLVYTFLFNQDEPETYGALFPSIGARIYNSSQSVFFRIAITPAIGGEDSIRVIPWAGISFGIRF